uniref:Saposin B-type domain-containing protein n=1 Tax=Strongyloides venezuelensis TaxID=75913 RepID=A0A0K0FI42_STRVS
MKFLIFILLILKVLVTFEQSITCRLCIDFNNEIKELIAKGELDIVSKMATIFDKVTLGKQPFDSLCREFVVREGEAIIRIMEKCENSKLACRILHFC